MRSSTTAKLLIGVVWAGLLFYAFTAAPPDDPAPTQRLVRGTLQLSFAGIEPAVVAIWNLLGMVAFLYLSLLVPDGRHQRVWSWPFGLLMMVGGAFILVPWLLLRTEQDSAVRPFRLGMRIVRSAVYRWYLVGGVVTLTLYGVSRGSYSNFRALFWQSQIVHVMTLDLILCTLLLPYLITKLRRPQDLPAEPPWARMLPLIPLLGPALWNALYYRPAPLPESSAVRPE